MEVVKSNFLQSFSLFESLLPLASFAAFDLELTGIKGRPETWADTAETRYAKLRAVAMKFSIIQVGVCLFVEHGEEYEVYPFNFYVYPEEIYGPKSIVLETSAISFNKAHRMDFNKWIYEGIPYVNEAMDCELYSRFLGKVDSALEEKTPSILTREVDREAVHSLFCLLEDWLHSPKESLEIPNFNAFLRKHITSRIKTAHPELYIDSVATGERNKANIVIHKHISAERLQEQVNKYHASLGFRRVFKLLKEASKPIIGHNMIADLLFLFNSMEARLPETLAEFKKMVTSAFPVVFDTRHLFSSLEDLQSEFNATSQYRGLKEIYAFLQGKVGEKMFVLPRGFEKYQEEIYAHEAGFDALMTGMCFIYMQRLEGDASSQANLIPLFKCYYLLNLAGCDLREPGHYVCVRLSDSPSAAAFLYSLSAEGTVEVKPIDDSMMVVKVDLTENLQIVLRSLAERGFSWVSLEDYLVNKGE